MSKSFTLNIRLGNDAMQTGHDVADALEKAGEELRWIDGGLDFDGPRTIWDINGNRVGSYAVQEADR